MQTRDQSTVRKPRGRPRRVAAIVAATALGTSMLAATVGSPVSAEPVAVTDATFEWGISEEVGAKAPPFGGCNYLSAGASDGTAAAYKASEGTVSVARVDGATPTYATRCTGVGSPFQKVVWTGGTGTVDPTTGVATLAFDGQLSINFYGGLVPFTIEDPVLTVGPGGDGQLVATMFGWESSMEDPTVKVPVAPVPGVVVADLSGADVAGTGFTVTPDYAGVEYTPPAGSGGTPQNRTISGWGSWPASFVDFHYLTGLTSYWYSSGGAADPFKAPSAITFSYSDVGSGDPDPDPDPDPEPDEGEQVIEVTIPEETVEPGGELILEIEDDGSVALSEAINTGGALEANGAIDPVKVTDTREPAATWTASGQVSDFTGDAGTIPASSLGWTPSVLSTDAGATAGAPAAPGTNDGDGLDSSRVLGSTSTAQAGTTRLGADLLLQAPLTTPEGSYSATLTLTVLG